MSDKTGIEWCDATWSPVDGCTPVSTGCKNCFAEKIAKRFWGERKFSDVQCHPDRLDIPLKWKKPRRIFVCSMGDIFHESVPTKFIDSIIEVMMACPQHTFIVLTKRAELMYDKLYGASEGGAYFMRELAGGDYVANLQLGTTIENQEQADKRIPWLLKVPAAVRFLSVEPLLGAVDLRKWLPGSYECSDVCGVRLSDPGNFYCVQCEHEIKDESLCPKCGNGESEPICPDCLAYMIVDHPETQALTGVICGCESGPGARETKIEWVRNLRDQCAEAGVPFFLKQLMQNGKLVKMPLLDGVIHDALPEGK